MAGKGSDFEINGSVNISAAGANAALDQIQRKIGDVARASESLNKDLGGEKKTTLAYKIVVDDSGIKQLVFFEKERLTVLDKANAELERARRLQNGSKTSLQQQVNQAKQARDEMAKYASSTGGVNAKLGTINAAWATQNQRVQDLQRQLDLVNASNIWQKLAAEYNLKGLASAGRQITELVNVFQSVSIIVGQVIGSVNQLFDTLQRIQSIELTFQGIGAGTDVGAVFSESSRIALGLGVNLNTVRDAFQQLSPVILATGGNIGNVSDITESLSSRFVTFGLSADKSRRVMNGVVQAFSKGKLMAEELTQQISEADPAFRTDLANAIGVSVKELGEMVKAGEVTNQVLLEAIPRMSKVAGLFGKLGNTATDAAKGFRDGGITVEQFRAQLGNIEQLALEDLINPDTGPLKPLLASLVELRAVVTDVAVAFAGSEIFETFLNTLGQVSSQVTVVVQAIVKIVSVIASITEPILGTINAIDSLGGTLKGFGIISTTVAAVIVIKLVAALATLGSGTIVGAATAAITGLSTAIKFLNSGALLGLANTIATTIVQILGLTTATAGSTAAQAADTAASKARAGAKAFLLKQLGLQAAADALAASAASTAAAAQVKTAGGIVITGAAAAAATPPVTALATATTGLSAAFLAALPLIAGIALAVGAAVAGYVIYKAATKGADEITSKFSTTLEKIKASAAIAKEALKNGASGADEFTASLNALDKERQKLEASQKFDFTLTGVFNEGVNFANSFGESLKNIEIQGAIDAAKTLGEAVLVEMTKAKKAVDGYNAANDKSGVQAKRIAQDIAVSQSAVGAALDLTRAKRAALLEEEAKNSGVTSQQTTEKLRAFDAQIKKLEEYEKKEAAVRAQARKKGILVEVELNVKDAAALTGDIQEELKGLKASVVLETNPEKRAELQGDLNALAAQLQFLEGDRTEIIIEANYKINTRALKDAADLGAAFLENLKAAADQAQSALALETAWYTAQEKAGQDQLDIIKERLDAEKELRKEKIDAAEEAGASEAEIKALKKADLAAEKAGREEIKKVERDLKDIAEDKKRIEIEAIQAKIAALPAQQAAEREGLKIQQELARLELERLLNASKRAKIEGQGLLIKTGNDISKAVNDKDPEEEQRLRDLYNSQLAYLKLLDAEQVSLTESISKRETIDALQRNTLGLQQQATSNTLQAELAALGIQNSQTATATAVQNTATAMANVASNAAGYAQAARTGSEYEKSGALAARLKADAEFDAAKAAAEAAGSTEEYTQATQDAAGATEEAFGAAQDAEGATGDTTTNLQNGATAAQDIADALGDLDGKQITVNVNYVGGPSGLWTGGPTTGGQTYRINELGKEGFLSSSGTLSPINKPRNALWKAPGRGMVIPAHIMSTLDVPTGRVSTGVRPSVVGSGGNGLTKIARAIQAALSQASKPDSGLQEMAAVQAHQAIQIGKLSRAVTKLADKDWNVNVGVRNTGSTAYLDALNRRM